MGTSENPDEQPFEHYTAKHKIVAWVSRHLFDGITYTSRRGLLEGMKRKGGLGWLPAALSKSVETAEYRFWKSLNLKALVVYDVGAFQGLLTLFFARQAKAVICYEPNTRNYTRLMENIRLNGLQNVTVRKMGAGSISQDATMVFSQLMPGGASIEPAIAGRIRIAGGDTATETIHITTLDQDIQEASLPAPDFVKIDIEGFEIEALRGARNTLTAHSPALFLEMHGETMNQKRRKVQEIIEFLQDTGYQTIRHVETGTEVHRANADTAAEGHLYCPGRSMKI
jgi:FkbM family methyltransferase